MCFRLFLSASCIEHMLQRRRGAYAPECINLLDSSCFFLLFLDSTCGICYQDVVDCPLFLNYFDREVIWLGFRSPIQFARMIDVFPLCSLNLRIAIDLHRELPILVIVSEDFVLFSSDLGTVFIFHLNFLVFDA